jgi:tetratricopeptide (TPR) repeat protein
MANRDRLIKTILLFLLPGFLNAQNGVYFIPSEKQTDSVRAELSHSSSDTLKMLDYYYLTSYYTELNKDSSLYFAELQLQYAQKLNQKLWEGDALFQIGYIAFGLGNYPRSLNALTDGLSITEDKETEKNNWRIKTFSGDGKAHRARLFIVASLHQIFAFLYENVGDNQKAISEYRKAIEIAQTIDDAEELSLDYMSLGNQYLGMDKLDSALAIENNSIAYAIKSNYKDYLGTILTSIGDIYFTKKNYDSTERYYHDALQASIEQNNLKDQILIIRSMLHITYSIIRTVLFIIYSLPNHSVIV